MQKGAILKPKEATSLPYCEADRLGAGLDETEVGGQRSHTARPTPHTELQGHTPICCSQL